MRAGRLRFELSVCRSIARDVRVHPPRACIFIDGPHQRTNAMEHKWDAIATVQMHWHADYIDNRPALKRCSNRMRMIGSEAFYILRIMNACNSLRYDDRIRRRLFVGVCEYLSWSIILFYIHTTRLIVEIKHAFTLWKSTISQDAVRKPRLGSESCTICEHYCESSARDNAI